MEEHRNTQPQMEPLMNALRAMTRLVILLLGIILLFPVYLYFGDDLATAYRTWTAPKPVIVREEPAEDPYWKAPSLSQFTSDEERELVTYGRELIAHTAVYLGPKGSVKPISNGMNCQNCHMDAGTKVFGNNYSAVASTYPKFRARSGSEEDIPKRVNDCFERSLNGQPLDPASREMQAIVAYMEFLGKDVPSGVRPPGAGLIELRYLNRAADPKAGREIYAAKCQSCHQPDGHGQLALDGKEYAYPPLWGDHSYNDAAGLYRVTNFARYVKTNMPQGATHRYAILTDDEAWDVAAFVNSQPRPHKAVPADWPDLARKPVDHPFGPYADGFSEQQHKYGPWGPIESARKSLSVN